MNVDNSKHSALDRVWVKDLTLCEWKDLKPPLLQWLCLGPPV